MQADTPSLQVELDLERLQHKLENVLREHARLEEENRVLRQKQQQSTQERSALIAKNEKVRARVEAMIARLKSMEDAS